jgi:hypothetical protein
MKMKRSRRWRKEEGERSYVMSHRILPLKRIPLQNCDWLIAALVKGARTETRQPHTSYVTVRYT